ncbi:MAG: hypothetical protein LBV79_01170 [Candidatus Adiutrix sp.]|jgi:hypothetical protein|nr:hypothetical protein [Candidatus Adiutrix sp.]
MLAIAPLRHTGESRYPFPVAQVLPTRAFCNLPAFSKLQNTQTSGRFSFFAYDLETEKRSKLLPHSSSPADGVKSKKNK